MGTEDSDVEESLAEPKAPKKKGAKKVVKKVAKKAAKKNGSGATRQAAKEEGVVTIVDLANEAGITAQAVRIKLRGSDIERGEGRWKFDEGSKRLKQARQLLGIGA